MSSELPKSPAQLVREIMAEYGPRKLVMKPRSVGMSWDPALRPDTTNVAFVRRCNGEVYDVFTRRMGGVK